MLHELGDEPRSIERTLSPFTINSNHSFWHLIVVTKHPRQEIPCIRWHIKSNECKVLKSLLLFFTFSFCAKQMLSHHRMHVTNYGIQTSNNCQQWPRRWLQWSIDLHKKQRHHANDSKRHNQQSRLLFQRCEWQLSPRRRPERCSGCLLSCVLVD